MATQHNNVTQNRNRTIPVLLQWILQQTTSRVTGHQACVLGEKSTSDFGRTFAKRSINLSAWQMRSFFESSDHYPQKLPTQTLCVCVFVLNSFPWPPPGFDRTSGHSGEQGGKRNQQWASCMRIIQTFYRTVADKRDPKGPPLTFKISRACSQFMKTLSRRFLPRSNCLLCKNMDEVFLLKKTVRSSSSFQVKELVCSCHSQQNRDVKAHMSRKGKFSPRPVN